MYCIDCKSLISNADQFCPYCGAENPNYIHRVEVQEQYPDEQYPDLKNDPLIDEADLESLTSESYQEDDQFLQETREDFQNELDNISPDSEISEIKDQDEQIDDYTNEDIIYSDEVDREDNLLPKEAYEEAVYPESAVVKAIEDTSELPHRDTKVEKTTLFTEKRSGTKIGKFVLGFVLIILFVFLVLLIIPTPQKTINLREYFAVDADKINLDINVQALQTDYGALLQKNHEISQSNLPDIIKKIKMFFPESAENIDSQVAQNFLDDVLSYEIISGGTRVDGDKLLSASDIKVTLNQVKAEDIWLVKLDPAEYAYSIDEEVAAKKINPFDQIEIEFTGYNEEAKVAFKKKSTYKLPEDVFFTYEPEKDLKNGDKIKVFVESKSANLEKVMLEAMQAELSQINKEYEVKGLEENPLNTTTETTTAPTTAATTQAVIVTQAPTQAQVPASQAPTQAQVTAPSQVPIQTQAPVQTQGTTPTNPRPISPPADQGYAPGIIFPNSSNELISTATIQQLSDASLRGAINEIYARNGYIFRNTYLLNYYRQFSWYIESIPADSFSQERDLNSIEFENIRRLSNERNSR